MVIIVLPVFALETVYKCVNLSTFRLNHCKPCYDKERLENFGKEGIYEFSELCQDFPRQYSQIH